MLSHRAWRSFAAETLWQHAISAAVFLSVVMMANGAAAKLTWVGTTGIWYGLANWQSNLAPKAAHNAINNNGGAAPAKYKGIQKGRIQKGTAGYKRGHVHIKYGHVPFFAPFFATARALAALAS